MNDRIKETFEMIKAESELKDGVRDFIQKNAKDSSGLYSRPLRRRLIPVVICMMFIFMGAGGYWVYFTPTAAVSIDINPSLELGINRFDKVISVDGYNDDGKELAASLDIRFEDYEDAIDTILEDEKIVYLLSNDEILSISVIGPDGKQCEKIYSHVESCTDGHENAYCYSIDEKEAEKAHDEGLSYGKYRAFLQLKEIYPSITADEVKDMTMKEINDLISSASESDSGNDQNGQHENGHHGSENGNHHNGSQ